MEAGGKLGGLGSLEVSGWYHTLLSSDGSSAHPPFLRPPDLIHSFCLWSLGFPEEFFLTLCNRIPHPGFLRGLCGCFWEEGALS